MFHTGSRAVVACMLMGATFFGCAAPMEEGIATEEEALASFTFTVTSRAGNPVVLMGTASPSSLFKLQSLTVITSGSDRTIKKLSPSDRITATTAEMNTFTTMPIPSTLSIQGEDAGSGNFTVQSIVLN